MAYEFTTNPLDWVATDGIYIAEQAAPAAPRLVGANVTQIVGAFPWGAPNVIHKIGSAAELERLLLGKASTPRNWSGYRYIVGKRFGQLEVVRVEAADAAAATRTVGADGYKADAKYSGSAGNEITIRNVNNTTSFDVTVTWGAYTKTYPARTLANVAAIVDPYVTFSTVGGADTIPATDGAPVALAGGSDGTLADADYTGGPSDVVGLRVLESGSARAKVGSDRASATILSALRDHAALIRGQAAADAPDLTDFDAAEAIAGAFSDARCIFALHGVKQTINGVEYTVPLSSFVLSVLSQIPPHYSIADAEFCRSLLASITAPADGIALNRTNWIRADVAGGVMLEQLDGGGFKFHANLTTDTTDADKALISTRNVVDLCIATVAKQLEPLQNKPGMPKYERLALNQAKRACALLRGDAQRNPLTAYVENIDVAILASETPNTRTFKLAIDLWDEIRYIVVLVTSGQTLDVASELAE